MSTSRQMIKLPVKTVAVAEHVLAVGPTTPTFHSHPVVWVSERNGKPHSDKDIFSSVARAVSAYQEIRPCVFESDKGLRHTATDELLTPEWLLEYLPKAVEFREGAAGEERTVAMPPWLPRMMIDNSHEFSAAMWSAKSEACGVELYIWSDRKLLATW